MSLRAFLPPLMAAAAIFVLLAAVSMSMQAGEEAAPDAEEQTLQERIDKLIGQLGADEWQERKAAKRALAEIGDEARDALEKARENKDPEIAASAEEILRLLNKLNLVFICIGPDGKPLADKAIGVVVSNTAGNISLYGEADAGRKSENLSKGGHTDADGKFSFDPFEGMLTNMLVSIEGYAPVTVNTTRFQKGTQIIRLKFSKGGTVEGVVLDPENNNAPVMNARVTIGGISTMTDNEGRFGMINVSGGKRRITVWVVGVAGNRFYKDVAVKGGDTTETAIEAPFAVSRQSSCRAVVRLLKPDGKPLAGEQIALSVETFRKGGEGKEDQRESISHGNFVTSGEDGACVINLKAGIHNIRLFVKGYRVLELGKHDFKPNEAWTLEKPVTLDKGLSARVIVKDDTGAAVEGASVVAASVKGIRQGIERPGRLGGIGRRGEALGVWGMPATDAQGTATPEGLEEGENAFCAFKPGYSFSECRVVNIAKDGPANVEMVLVRNATAEVTALDAETIAQIANVSVDYWKKPLPRQLISHPVYYLGFNPPRDWHFPSGRQYLTISAPGYAPQCLVREFKPGEKAVETVKLKKAGSGALTGRIEPYGKEQAAHIACAILYPVTDPYCLSSGFTLILRVNRRGEFGMPELPPGVWGIALRDSEDRLLLNKMFRIESGKTADVTMKLKPAGSLEATALDSAGKPKPGVQFVLLPFDNGNFVSDSQPPRFLSVNFSDPVLPATTDDNGKCRFEGYPEGKYRLVEYLPESAIGARAEAEITAGKTNSVSVRMPATTTTVSGRVVNPDIGYNLQIVMFPETDAFLETDGSEKARTRPDGSFTIIGVPPGRYRIAAKTPGSRWDTSLFTVIEVKEGAPVGGVEIRLPEKTQKVSGKITGYRMFGNGSTEEHVILHGDCFLGIPVRPDGTFEGEAPPGKYTLYYLDMNGEVTDKGPTLKTMEITIEEGKDLVIEIGQ